MTQLSETFGHDSSGATSQHRSANGGANLIMTSVRLDRDLHQTLRQIAFERRVSMHSLLIEGARAVQQRYTASEAV